MMNSENANTKYMNSAKPKRFYEEMDHLLHTIIERFGIVVLSFRTFTRACDIFSPSPFLVRGEKLKVVLYFDMRTMSVELSETLYLM